MCNDICLLSFSEIAVIGAGTADQPYRTEYRVLITIHLTVQVINFMLTLPVSAYATERMVARYGNADKGYMSFRAPIVFSENDPAYLATRKQVICDTQGVFRFYDLPDGEFFILTGITWFVNNAPRSQGGALMQRVSLAGGETKEIVLTR